MCRASYAVGKRSDRALLSAGISGPCEDIRKVINPDLLMCDRSIKFAYKKDVVRIAKVSSAKLSVQIYLDLQVKSRISH